MDEEFEYEYDEELIQQQQEDIKNVVATGPLIGEAQDIAFLRQQFADAPRFLAKVPQLEQKYQSIRCVRGDGNCFYRSYLIGCLELGLKKPAAFELLYKQINDSKVKLVTQGFSEYIIEDFWETCMEFLNWIRATRATIDQICEKMSSDPALSQYLISYLRLLASFHLQANQDSYCHFVDEDMLEFVRKYVEPVDCEADQLQCVALAHELGIPLRIEQLTQQDDLPISSVDILGDENTTDRVCVLFRPGHYDLLYVKSQ